jgi:hypothetical protein
MVSVKEFQAATVRARDFRRNNPYAVSARYDRKSGRIIIDLSSRVSVSFSPEDAQDLEHAKPSQLEEIEVSPSGYGIHFPELDADLYIPALLEGLLGSRKWMAARLGQAGGRSQSRAKREAARANGKLGGRPRRRAAAAGD